MAEILYIGQTAGFLGGIERYMGQTAQLLRNNGERVIFAGDGSTGRLQNEFSRCFDRIETLEALPGLIQHADLIIIHKIIPETIMQMLPPDRTFFFAHDHQAYCRRHHYYTPLGRINCRRPYAPLRCFLCALGRNTPPPLNTLRTFPAIVLSDFMKENLMRNGFSPDRIFKIPPFIQAVPRPPENKFMPDGILRLLFLGQLIRGKGCHLLLRALRRLSVPFRTVIAGDGKDRPWLEQLTRSYDLENKVVFTGWLNTPENLFAEADLLVFPSLWQEPFGLGGLEALAHALPVLAFSTGGISEWLKPEQTGLAVPERNIREAARALEFCGSHPELLKQWGQNGLQMVQTQFSPERFLNDFHNLTGGKKL